MTLDFKWLVNRTSGVGMNSGGGAVWRHDSERCVSAANSRRRRHRPFPGTLPVYKYRVAAPFVPDAQCGAGHLQYGVLAGHPRIRDSNVDSAAANAVEASLECKD